MIENFAAAWVWIKPKFHRAVRTYDLHPGKIVVTAEESFFVLFKRDFYHNFKNHFPHITKSGGVHFGFAQIMNKALLNKAISEGVDWIVFVMPDKHCYKCSAKFFKNFYDLYHTDVPYLEGEIAMPLDFFEPAFYEVAV